MMGRKAIFWFLVGVAAYYGFLRMRGLITGNPLSPEYVMPARGGP